MSDYIDRQAALASIKALFPDMPKIDFMDNRSRWREVYSQYLNAEEAIRQVPSADVAPVRRGYWIGGEIGNCSVCGHRGCASDIWTGCWAKGKTFCPACGAILDDEYWDEEEDDNAE